MRGVRRFRRRKSPCSQATARGRGCVEWFRLVNESPELEMTLVDGPAIADGALDGMDALVIPGGASVSEKKNLGPEGVKRVKDFIRAGGGYIGTCAGCSLLLDESAAPDRGISVIPFGREGSKGGFMMPLALNEKCAAATGLKPGQCNVSYHAGPILTPSTNFIEGADFDVWATYAGDFHSRDRPNLTMLGKPALVGGTYGRGRVFAITCHPEANIGSLDIVKGAFRYVLGRVVTFPPRVRRQKSFTVAAFASVISGIDTARTLLDIDGIDGVDFFPVTGDEIFSGQLDRVDCLVLPDGNLGFYEKKYAGNIKELIEKFVADGGCVATWGNGAAVAPSGAKKFESGAALVESIRRKAAFCR